MIKLRIVQAPHYSDIECHFIVAEAVNIENDEDFYIVVWQKHYDIDGAQDKFSHRVYKRNYEGSFYKDDTSKEVDVDIIDNQYLVKDGPYLRVETVIRLKKG